MLFGKCSGKLPGFFESGGLSMPLIQVVLALIVVGVLLWLVNNFIPMAGSIKSILNAVVVICVVVFGLLNSIYHVHLPPR